MPPERTHSSAAEERPADEDAARAAAIALLARRDLASAELTGRLESQGFTPQVIAAVMDELVEARLLNDARYAENYVTSHSGRGQGPLRIAADLRALGVAEELIDAALESGPDWRALADEVRRRKFGPEPPETWPEKARQARFLQYRGFSSDHICFATGADVGEGS
jgi:regulatory protein